MSSHRNAPSFSRLKEVLSAVPAVPEPASADPVSPEVPAGRESAGTPIVEEYTAPLETAALVPANAALVSRSVLPAKPGKRKALAKTATFRLAIELLDALRNVAEYNNLNQGDIVSEALCLHLQNFTWPPGPESEKLRDAVRQLL
jgi:hypothetical protein